MTLYVFHSNRETVRSLLTSRVLFLFVYWSFRAGRLQRSHASRKQLLKSYSTLRISIFSCTCCTGPAPGLHRACTSRLVSLVSSRLVRLVLSRLVSSRGRTVTHRPARNRDRRPLGQRKLSASRASLPARREEMPPRRPWAGRKGGGLLLPRLEFRLCHNSQTEVRWGQGGRRREDDVTRRVWRIGMAVTVRERLLSRRYGDVFGLQCLSFATARVDGLRNGGAIEPRKEHERKSSVYPLQLLYHVGTT